FGALELALEGLIEGVDPEGELERLRRLARLSPPDAQRVEEAIEALEATGEQLDAMAATAAARDAGVTDLLDAALRHRQEHDDPDCPVCGTPNVLEAGWIERTADEVHRLRAHARDYEVARDNAGQARRALQA